jgi:hypothetical protein
MACPVSVQERLQGWRCKSFPFGRHACVISRVGLTEGRRLHSGGRGGVLSPRTPTASGMALQCPGCRYSGGNGCTGPMVTEDTRLTGLTSWCCPGPARNRRPSLFEGSTVPLRGCSVLTVRKWVAQCHGADTGLAAQCHTVAGMASPGGLAEQRRDMIPRRVRGSTWRGFVFDSGTCMCQNIKCSGQGSRYGGGEPVKASSEAETHLRGVSGPRARRNLTRGGVWPSSVEEPHPRGRPTLERGGTSILWSCAPRAKWSFARGWLGLTVLVGHRGRQDRGPLLLSRDCLECVLRL